MNRYSHLILEALLVLLFAMVVIASSAQSQRTIENELLYEKVQRLSDSIDNLQSDKTPRYIGYEISLAFPQYQLKSNIAKLNGAPISFCGGNIGGMVANQQGKVKANFGIYYSDASVPYTIDLLAASVTSNIYLLRLKNPTYHTIEPYAILGVQQQMSRFFGNYLDNAGRMNYSVSDEPSLGNTNATQVAIGGGLEYQLENDRHQFIHLFIEFTYGRTVNTISSNKLMSATSTLNPALITMGVNFGLVK